jgi:hypothetical protein
VKLDTIRNLPAKKLQALAAFVRLRHDIDTDCENFEKQME